MRIFLLFILSLFVTVLLAQKSTEVQNLEAKRKTALSEIEATSKILNQTKKSQKNILNRINLINQQINSRKEVVLLLNNEISAMDKDLSDTDASLRSLEQQYEKKKEKYANALRKMQRNNGVQDKLIFILSADNLTQSYRRFRYLKEYSGWQKLQAEGLILQQKEIAAQKERIKKSRHEKLGLLQTREIETANLEREENTKEIEIQELKKKENILNDEINQKKKTAQALNRQIEKVITEEIARSEREAKARREAERKEQEKEAAEKEKTKRKPTVKEPEKIEKTTPIKTEETRVAETKGGYAMTKEERTLSSGFANNKGRLPFPLKGNHRIIVRFGLHQHPDLKNIQVNSNGIDIQTSSNNNATSVFNGVVSKVFTLAGSNNVVIVRHGNYLTVYSNLSEVYVKAGDNVKTGQNIGKIFTDTEENNATILHFEVWKETSKLNPEDWLN